MEKYIIELPENLHERKRALWKELRKIEGLLARATIKAVFELEGIDEALAKMNVGKPHILEFGIIYESDDEGGSEPWVDWLAVYDKDRRQIDLDELSETHAFQVEYSYNKGKFYNHDYRDALRDAMHELNLEQLPDEIVFGDDE